MLWTKRLMAAVLVGGLLVAISLAGCEKDLGEPADNLEPQTTLSYSPEEGDTSNYRVRMNWFGWDPDGEISHFLAKWDTLDWRRVISTDSVFYVSASLDENTEEYGYEYHSFKIKAVDNEGLEDASPESVSFTAFTFVPETSFQEVNGAPSDPTGPMVTFRWKAEDKDGVISYYDYHLLAWNEVEEVWDQVVPQPSQGEWYRVDASVTRASFGPLSGDHRFEVRAIDDAGAIDQTPAVREFTSLTELAGAKLFISCNVFQINNSPFRGPVWPPSANNSIPIFAGERMRFDWIATAVDYGGEVMGYRHAYDDTSTWPAWSIFDTRFEVAPTPGGHNLYVSALDNSNIQTRARIRFNVIEASLDDFILIVDDWNWRENYPEIAGWGTDEQRTTFYDEMLAGFVRDRIEWEPEDVNNPPDVTTLQGASTVIWYCDDDNTLLGNLFSVGSSQYNTLTGYVRAGGNLLMCGRKGIGQITGIPSYSRPNSITIAPGDTTQAATFIRDFLHIGYAQESGSNQNKDAPWHYGYCFYGGYPTPAWEDVFAPVYVDSAGPGGYPERGKWPLYASSSANLSRCGISNVETIQAFQGTAEEFLQMDSFLNWNFEAEPCGVLYLSGDNHGNSCYLGFPLYFCQNGHVKPFIDTLLELFGEEKIQTP